MHELSITQNIVDIVLSKAQEVQASKVTRISLVIGELSGFATDCVGFYFDFLSKGTIAEAAALEFQSVPAQLRCRVCSTTFGLQDDDWICPKCHDLTVEIVSGREMYIESMEVE